MAPKPKAVAPKASLAKVKATPKSPLVAAAKGIVGGDAQPKKGAAPVAAKAKSAATASVLVAIEPAAAGPTYDGKPMQLKEAEALFQALSPADMQSLASSTSTAEQLPARMLLELVGDKDLTWANAAKSLRDAANFKKEVLDMDGASYVTKGSIDRFAALGTLQPNELREKHPVAFAVAIYLEAVIWAAKEKLGMNVAEAPPPPAEGEKPPEWPIMVGIQELPAALADARRWSKTPLFLCSGKVSVVDTFFQYQSATLVDAKWILSKVDVKKELSVSDVREEVRKRLIAALKFGQPIHIAMSNSAVTLKAKYCSDAEFPEGLFNNELWFTKEVHSKIVRESDLTDWPGAFPGAMKGTESYSFVTSDFSLESAREFLPAVLPHFEDMAIIQIDPATIDS